MTTKNVLKLKLLGKINFRVFTKNCQRKQQTTRQIRNSMKSKVFDELLLIEIMIKITKLSEESYGLLSRIIDHADESDR